MEALADRAGVELPKQEYTSAQRQEADKRARLLEINKEAAKYFTCCCVGREVRVRFPISETGTVR